MPPANSFVRPEDLGLPERRYPLRMFVCERCWLAQADDVVEARTIFSDDYAYFSGMSSTWIRHAERYAHEMVRRFSLGPRSRVIEVAANDGCLLQQVDALGVPCLGIEPTASAASIARARGLHVIQSFLDAPLADRLVAQGVSADLMVANNVLAHVPDINDFVTGFTRLLKPHGVATFEFQSLVELVDHAQFDTIYHEHFSYLSLTSVLGILKAAGLAVFDVERLATHGGSLRVFAQRSDTGIHAEAARVSGVLREEERKGIRTTRYYDGLRARADRVRNGLSSFLADAAARGKRLAAYGASAKGSTLLNFVGASPRLIRYVVDMNPAKQGKHMPGTGIPIVGPDALDTRRPDYLLVLARNLLEEVRARNPQLSDGRTVLVTAVPELRQW